MILIRTTVSFSVILKMDEINKTRLSDQTKFQLSEIIGVENYFTKRLIKENQTVKN